MMSVMGVYILLVLLFVHLLTGFRLKDTGTCPQFTFLPQTHRTTVCHPGEDQISIFKRYGYDDTGIPEDLSEYTPHLLHESSVIRYFDADGEWEYLSNGTFAIVHTGEMRETGERVVIKQFTLETEFFDVEKECRLLMYLADTGLVPKFYGYMPSGPSLYNITIILEHLVNTEGITATSERGDVSMFQWVLIFEQFLNALQTLHKKYVLHNDLHRENILIQWNHSYPKVYLIDTGFSTFREGTFQFMSIETLNRYPFFPPESKTFESNPSMDVYGFGYVVDMVNNNVQNEDLQIIADWCRQYYSEDRPTTDELLERIGNLKLKYQSAKDLGYVNTMTGVIPVNERYLKFVTTPIPILILGEITPMPSIIDELAWMSLDDEHGTYRGLFRNHSVVIRLYANKQFSQIRNEAAINLFASSLGLVPKFYGIAFYDHSIMDVALIQEYLLNTVSLEDAISENRNWSIVYRKQVACEILKVLSAFHKEHILVNNIEASNILYTRHVNGTTAPGIKFTHLHDHSDSSGLEREPEADVPIFAAPEINQNYTTSFASDVYSVGLVFKDLFNSSTLPVINETINLCLNKNRDLRPTVGQLIKFMGCEETMCRDKL